MNIQTILFSRANARLGRQPRVPLVALLSTAVLACTLLNGQPVVAQAKRPAQKPAAKPAAAAPKAQAPLKPYVVKIPGTTASLEMVPIPGGTLTVADPTAPGGSRTLKVAPFWISRTEVTWEAFDGFYLSEDPPAKPGAKADAISRPSKSYYPPDRGFGHQGYPAISLHSLSALNFCKWLGRETGHRYRLATEVEWEYAARAGDTTSGPLPKEKLEEMAWVWENSDDTSHPVAKKKPNAWGLFDMLGNAGEWVIAADGKPVLAGGSWNDKGEKVHYGTRMPYSPAWQNTDPQHPKSKWWLADGPFVGFRIVRVP